MLRWHLWLSTHLFSLDKCDATQFLHHIGRLATAPANLQPSSRLQPMHPWSPPQLGHPWALSSSGMWANMIKASVTTAHLSYRFPILKLPPPPCAVLLVLSLDITWATSKGRRLHKYGWFLGILQFFPNRSKWFKKHISICLTGILTMLTCLILGCSISAWKTTFCSATSGKTIKS